MSCSCHTGMPPCSWCTRPLCVRCDGEISKDCEGWPDPLCEACLDKVIDKVPIGTYCYTSGRICPFWSRDDGHPPHENGMCALIGLKDWESPHLSMLWDQVKECGLNDS